MSDVKYKIEVDITVADGDQDLMSKVPDVIMERFRGTAIRIDQVNVKYVTIDQNQPHL